MRLALFLALTAALLPAAPADCARCHRSETASFDKAGMTRALLPGSGTLNVSGDVGAFHYTIAGSKLTVSTPTDRLEYPIAWTFGEGATGQTFLYQTNGRWHESRVSYFATLKALDVTIGQQPATNHPLPEAAGRELSTTEAAQCFSCHATNTTTAGIQCDRCHGPSDAHLKSPAQTPRRLSKLSTEEQADFCGECHRTWAQISIKGPRGIQNVRFQPYRLANSKCYDAADARIRCTACHNPHQPLETKATAYDSKCQACHQTCKAGNKSDCVTCHMPRIDLPGAHKAFVDHRIRVVRPGEVYPD